MRISESDNGTEPANILIGLLDSGISKQQMSHLFNAAEFCKKANSHLGHPAYQDRLGHGSVLAQVLIDNVPDVQICVARIFDQKLTANVSQVVAGLDWLVEQGVRVINLSFGLHQDRLPLAQACKRAIAAGVILVAASPATGEQVYPANYPDVIRVTGDFRCQPSQCSWQPSDQADLGACVRAGHSRVVGASVATAYISARIGQYFELYPATDVDRAHMVNWLKDTAHYQKMQHPFAPIPVERRLAYDREAS